MSTETPKAKHSVGAVCKDTAANAETTLVVATNIAMRVKGYSIVYSTGKGRARIVTLNSKKDAGVQLITDAPVCHFGSVIEREPPIHPCNFELQTSEQAWLKIKAPASGLAAEDVSIVLHGEVI